MRKDTILTGLRTNAEYHLGNYLGAILPMVHMARTKVDDYNINMFAPDLHSFTTPIDHSAFQAQTLHNLKLFVACGMPISHKNVRIYRQSRIAAHSELTWILSNFTGYGEMARMVEFKEKSERVKDERVSVGLFSYPILMAADILLYGAAWVPVGEDQRQHLEFTRTLAERMNSQFGELFVVPKTIDEQQSFVSRDGAPRIKSLRDPSRKMSKSVSDPAGTILLSDSPEVATKKIMGATTDTVGAVNYDPINQPGVTNLLVILALLSDHTQDEVNAQWTGSERYGDLKKATAEAVASILQKIQEKIRSIDEVQLISLLEENEAAVAITANEKLRDVQKAIGLR